MNAMKHKLDRCGLLLAGVLLLAVSAGCSRSSNQPPPAAEPRGPDPNTVAVRVDTHALTWGELNTLATNYYVEESRRLHIPEGRETEVMEAFQRRAADIFIYKTVMLDEARKAGTIVTPNDRTNGLVRMARTVRQQHGMTLERFFRESPFGEARAWREFEEGLELDVFIERTILPSIPISEADLMAEAKRRVTVRREQCQKAEALRQRLIAGEDFARLAAEFSQCPSGKRSGGSIGQLVRGKSHPAFEAAAFSQPLGEIGPVVETSEGLHIIRVDVRHAARPATATEPAIPEAVQTSHILLRTPAPANAREMEAYLRRARLADAVKAWFENARAKRQIETPFTTTAEEPR